MSRWLRSVNNLLETLDTGVENVVEHRTGKYSEEDEDEFDHVDPEDVGGQSSVDDILAKRGILLSQDDDDEEEDEVEDEGNNDQGNDEKITTRSGGVDDGDDDDECINMEMDLDKSDPGRDISGDNHKHQTEGIPLSSNENHHDVVLKHDMIHVQESPMCSPEELKSDNILHDGTESHPPYSTDSTHALQEETVTSLEQKQSQNENGREDFLDEQANDNPPASVKDTTEIVIEKESELLLLSGPGPTLPASQGVSPVYSQSQMAQIRLLEEALEVQKRLVRQATDEKKDAMKETRKLRRTIVKLNTDLDAADRELDAQRTELERAAARMEKDRQRFKEEKERMELSHKEDLKVISEEHRASVTAMANAHSKQITEMEARIHRAEEARAKEGGDMSAELADAAERERDAMKKIRILEEEKSTLVSQISSLKTQIAGLESRVELSQQAAESASERERDADNRLDNALSLHARQLSQRQTREAELERTIADLTAALVASRARETTLLDNKDIMNTSDRAVNHAVAELKEKLLGAKDEVEMLENQLLVEKHKAEALQQELEDMTRDQAQEALLVEAKQKEYDRRIADLNAAVQRLKAQNAGRNVSIADTSSRHSGSEVEVRKLQDQVASLSEDVLRQKTKLQNSATEIRTLRNRLKSALSRAEIAEKTALAHAYDLESNKFRNRELQNSRGKMTVKSIKSAFKLDAGTGETREILGKVIDTIDMAAVDMGSYFRSDPFARAVFLLYLIILHSWAFFLLIFHAHGTLEPAPNVGPEQLLKHSYRHFEQGGAP